MKVGYFQYRPLFGKVAQNRKKVVAALQQVEADLIVLPELAFTGYYFQNREECLSLAEDPAHSDTIDALHALCREKNMYIVSGFTERKQDKVFNSSVLVGPQGLQHTYRKLHLFNEEKNVFDPGDIALQVNSVKGAQIGMMVCFDWAFPEVTRSLVLQGAEIICHPSNLVLTFCQQTMLTRCLENRVFAITTNRYGADTRPQGSLKFTGKSQIVAPGGVLLNSAPAQRDALAILDINPADANSKRMTPLNDLLGDRRPEYYQELTAQQYGDD